ncbi:pyrroline-5-carboxylate reductase [Sphingopyxis terrae]|uniref:pyrroline-5-carboxylate reductase n=1 Tax=Sphingopyxis terrae TaxID=33052 RepID=UPI003F7D669C
MTISPPLSRPASEFAKRRMRILLVGHGRMGSALARAWLPDHELLIHDPSAEIPSGATRLADLGAAAQSHLDALILAVKPAVFPAIASKLAPTAARSLVISIMAGTRLSELGEGLAPAARIVRAMPNTPAAIGRGVTAAVAAPQCDDADRRASDTLLAAAGTVVWLAREVDLDTVTAVSGSGPAYFFRFAEALARAGEAAGLDPALAARLARETFTGAAALAEASEQTMAGLREEVTSPGGTTAAGLAVLARGRGDGDDAIDSLLRATVEAAAARSRAIGAS